MPSALASQGQESGPVAEQPTVEPDSLEGQVLALLRGEKKIEAIVVYRRQTGAGLKVAKDAVEALAAKHGISPKGASCSGILLLVLLVAMACAIILVWVLPR